MSLACLCCEGFSTPAPGTRDRLAAPRRHPGLALWGASVLGQTCCPPLTLDLLFGGQLCRGRQVRISDAPTSYKTRVLSREAMSPAQSNGRYSPRCLCCWPGGSPLSSRVRHPSLGLVEPPAPPAELPREARSLLPSQGAHPACLRGPGRLVPRPQPEEGKLERPPGFAPLETRCLRAGSGLAPSPSFSVKSSIPASNRQRPFGGCHARAVPVNDYRHCVSRSASDSSTSFSTQPLATGSRCGAHGGGKNQQRLSDGTRSRWGETHTQPLSLGVTVTKRD